MLKDDYQKLETEKYEFFERGHRSAILTVPSILPRDGQNRTNLPQNFQSTGARGVENMTSKLNLTLFPPTMPFMRLEVGPAAEAEIRSSEGGEQAYSEVMASLLRIEQQAVSVFDTEGWRPAMSEAMRQLVVTGNALIFARPGGRPAAYDMRRFVVERDAEGQLERVILRQSVSVNSAYQQLDGRISVEKLQEMVTNHHEDSEIEGIEMYTGAERLPTGKFAYWQEIAGIMVEEKKTILSESALPLRVLRFAPIYGSSYGRGYVECYDGDLLVLEAVSRALAEGALALAKILWLIKPGSTTKAQMLDKAPNGAIRQGDPDDVGTLQADKASDLSVALQIKRDIQVSLSNAFLLNSSVQRNGERVTAEEIRFVSQELEDALGGVYAALADTVQMPIVQFVFQQMQSRGQVGPLPDGVEFVVATGLESISRNHEAGRIQQWIGTLVGFVPPEQMATILNMEEIASQLATAYNLDKDHFIRSKEEIAEIQAQQQQADVLRDLGPETLRQIGNNAPTE